MVIMKLWDPHLRITKIKDCKMYVFSVSVFDKEIVCLDHLYMYTTYIYTCLWLNMQSPMNIFVICLLVERTIS